MADPAETVKDTEKVVAEPSPQPSPAPTSKTAPSEASTIKAQVEKAVSDALSKQGRTAKALKDQEDRLKAERRTFDAERSLWQKEREQAEEEKYSEDPAGWRALRERRARERETSELARMRTELETERTALAEREQAIASAERERLLATIVAETGADTEALSLLAPNFTPDGLRAMAALLSKKAASSNSDSETPLRVDSGRTQGGVNFNRDNIDDLWLKGQVPDSVYRHYITTGQITR